MKQCSNCGYLNENNARICNQCGYNNFIFIQQQPRQQNSIRKCANPNCSSNAQHSDGLCSVCHIKSFC